MSGKVKLTQEILHAGQSRFGGWSKAQTDLLGIPWPLRHGWKHRIIGEMIDAGVVAEFVRLKDKHLNLEPVGLFD